MSYESPTIEILEAQRLLEEVGTAMCGSPINNCFPKA